MGPLRRRLRTGLSPSGTTALYVALAALWIVFSDRFLGSVTGAPAVQSALETGRGLLLVLVTGGLLYALLRHREATVREREELYRRAIAQAGAVVYQRTYGAEAFDFVGEEIAALTGCRPQDLTVRAWRGMIEEIDMIGECEGIDEQEASRRALSGELSLWRADYRIRTRDGRTRWLADSAIPRRDASGRVVGTLGILQDISERRRTQLERECLHRLAERLTGPLTLTDVGRIVAEESRALFHHDAFVLAVLDESGKTLIPIRNEDTMHGSHEPVEIEVEAADYPWRDSPVADGAPKLINCLEGAQHHGGLRPFGFPEQISRCLMFVPIRWEKAVIGILSVQSHMPGRYTDHDLQLLQAFADHVGGTLAGVRAAEALQLSNRSLAVQNAVARATAGSLTPHELCDRLLGIVRGVMACDSFYVDRWDEAAGNTVGIRNYDTVDGHLQTVPVLRVPLAKGGPRHRAVVEQRQPLLIHRDDVHVESQMTARFGDLSRPSASLLWVPMVVRDHVVGIMSVQSYRPRAYSPRDVDLLQAIAQQAAPALEATLLAQALRESEERHRRAIAQANAVAYQLDYTTETYVYVGPEIERLTGYRPGEFTRDIWLGMIEECVMRGPAAGMSMEEAIRRSRDGEFSEWSADQRIRAKDGQIRWLADTSVPLRGDTGKPVGALGILQDITDRHRGEEEREALRRLSQRLTVPMSLAEFGRVVAEECRLLFGHDFFSLSHFNEARDQSVEIRLEDTPVGAERPVPFPPSVHPLDTHRRSARACILEGRSYLENREGEPDPASLTLEGEATRVSQSVMTAPIPWAGHTIGALSVQSYTPNRYSDKDLALLDLFASQCGGALMRVQAEEERRRLASAVEQSAETVVITDAQGIIEYVNPAFEQITGHPRAEALGKTPRILKSGRHDEAFYRDLWDTILRGQVWSGRLTNRRRDGSLFIEDETISPIRDSDGRIVQFVAVARDVTREVELEAQLRQAQKLEAVGQLAGGIAHDFNNLLLAILGFNDLATAGLAENDPRLADLGEVRQAAERAATLTRQLLAFSRRQMLNPVPLDINRVVGDLMKILRRVIGENIEFAVREGEVGTVHADPGQLEQVLMNLCVNARDAMPQGGRITIETGRETFTKQFAESHAWARPGEFARISVGDSGIGIPPDQIDHVFEPFFTTKEVGKGTGLGLATVYGIVQQHGGLVHVESQPGVGTAFHIHLPLVADLTPEPSGAGTKVRGGTETILLAEDEEIVRNLAVRLLGHAGYTVLTATDGEEAVSLFLRHRGEIDLLLLDAVMPKMSGQDVLDRIRELAPATRALFTSGYSAATLGPDFLADRGVQLLTKPYQPSQLLRRVREVLDA